MTPPEIYRTGDGERDMPGWQIRVTPNKYPLSTVHEVIVHSPEHTALLDMNPEQVEGLFQVFRNRFHHRRPEGQVIIFSNQGVSAGASLAHPHSQLVVVPPNIPLQTLNRQPVANILKENESSLSYQPEYLEWPHELWLAPKKEKTWFNEMTDVEIKDFTELFQGALRHLSQVKRSQYPQLQELGYNFYIYQGKNWYLRIIPRFVQRAGFELATGIQVNEMLHG